MNAGDRVVLDCNDSMFDDPREAPLWKGMTGTILQSERYDPSRNVRIQPDTVRPDGAGTEWFYWPDDLIKPE